MKFAPLAALGLALPALAGVTPAVPALAAEEAAPVAASLTIDTPIETLMADERAKAVVTKHFGGQDLALHPAYEQFKAISLKTLAPYSQGMITEEMLTAIAADLAAISGA